MFNRIVDVGLAAANGNGWQTWMHKTSLPVFNAAGMWADSSMGAGTPKYNAYVGTQGESTPMVGAGNFGIYVGQPCAPLNKHIQRMMLQTTAPTLAPSNFILCDYLMHYPLIDMDSTDAQVMDNVAALPRYADGNGVRIMPVCTTPQSAISQVIVGYTNSNGVSGRTSSFFTNIANTGMINNCGVSGQYPSSNPFIPLQAGDVGVRSIDSVTCQSSAGGFCAFVLVYPLANISVTEATTAVELDFIRERVALPLVYDGACLNYIYSASQSAVSAVVRGSLDLIQG